MRIYFDFACPILSDSFYPRCSGPEPSDAAFISPLHDFRPMIILDYPMIILNIVDNCFDHRIVIRQLLERDAFLAELQP